MACLKLKLNHFKAGVQLRILRNLRFKKIVFPVQSQASLKLRGCSCEQSVSAIQLWYNQALLRLNCICIHVAVILTLAMAVMQKSKDNSQTVQLIPIYLTVQTYSYTSLCSATHLALVEVQTKMM